MAPHPPPPRRKLRLLCEAAVFFMNRQCSRPACNRRQQMRAAHATVHGSTARSLANGEGSHQQSNSRECQTTFPLLWICSAAMRRATMMSIAPPSTCNLSMRQELPCQMQRRCLRPPPPFPLGSSAAGATSLCPAEPASRSGSRNLLSVRAADCQQPATDVRGQKRAAGGALLRPEQPKGARIWFTTSRRGELTRRAPGQRATAAAVPVRRAGEAMLPPQLRGRHVCTLCRSNRAVTPAKTGATSRPWTWTPLA